MRENSQKEKDAELRFDTRTTEDFAASLELSPHSVTSYKKYLSCFFKYLAERGIVKPESGDIAAYVAKLSTSGRSNRTIYGYVTSIRAFFRWTQFEGLYRDIASEIPLPKLDRMPNRKTLTAAQLKRVLTSINRETLQGMRDYAIVTLMLTAGLSALEVSKANIEDIYKTESKAESEYVLSVRKGDGQKQDTVKIQPHVMEAISKYLNARGDIKKPDAPLFISVSDRNRDKNEHMTVGSVSRIVKNALRNAGFDDRRLSAQSLKVSAIKLALQSGERLEDVQRFARHRQIRTTFLYERHMSEGVYQA